MLFSLQHLSACRCAASNILARSSKLVLQVGLRMFLNCSASATNWNADSTECSLVGRLCLITFACCLLWKIC